MYEYYIDKIYIDIGKRMAYYRKEQKLSQAKLAEKMGIRQQLIADYEIARRRMPISFIFKLVDALFIDVEDLLGLNVKNSKRGPFSIIQRKLELIRQLPTAKQKLALDVIDSIIKST